MITGLRVKQAVLLGLLVGIVGTARGGMITSFSSSGPGGTTTLAIDTNPGLPPGSGLAYTANFTAVAPITIAIGVDGPGQYYLAAEVAENVTNSTGEHWSVFDFILSEAPAGSRLAGASQSGPVVPDHFNIPPSFLPSPGAADDIRFSGGTGVAQGGGTGLGVTIVVAGSGPATFQVELAPSVPEPSAIVLFLSAGLCGLAFLSRRARRSAKAH